MNKRDTQKFRKALGRCIREARLTLGLSQAKLGKQLGVRPQMVQKWEYGRSPMDVTRFADICRALGLDAGKTFNGLIYIANGRKVR